MLKTEKKDSLFSQNVLWGGTGSEWLPPPGSNSRRLGLVWAQGRSMTGVMGAVKWWVGANFQTPTVTRSVAAGHHAFHELHLALGTGDHATPLFGLAHPLLSLTARHGLLHCSTSGNPQINCWAGKNDRGEQIKGARERQNRKW